MLKNDSQFKQDIGKLSLTSTDDKQGAELLKNWCNNKLNLPSTKENIEEILPRAQKYCTTLEKRKITANGGSSGLSWRKIKKDISNRGISTKGQLFVSFIESQNSSGRNKYLYYCWDTEKDTWINSEGTEDCRKKDGGN